MTTGTIYVGRAMALHVAGVGHLPELATRHHPAEMQAVVNAWRADGRDVVCFNPCALDAIPTSEAGRVMCVAARLNHLDGSWAVVMRPLNEHPDWVHWVTEWGEKPGEFWASVGEEWALDHA